MSNLFQITFLKESEAPRPKRRTQISESLDAIAYQMKMWPAGQEVLQITCNPDGERPAEKVAAGIHRGLKGHINERTHEYWRSGPTVCIRRLLPNEIFDRQKQDEGQPRQDAKAKGKK
jgi:hypothetical protein